MLPPLPPRPPRPTLPPPPRHLPPTVSLLLQAEGVSARVLAVPTVKPLDEDALTDARHGIYSLKAGEAVPEDLAERYLERCRLKTARLFECACLIGRVSGAEDPAAAIAELRELAAQ